ncbi:SRPBCC family protein [Deinococcus maricopensis]|uniref:Polyketide cyclase/dehydrase n=1 Tax=Deinococcus maricopensis (strain DSM 21211 / LMG 22137 / NRRL B-23946 / LB-34) TaxID=709986 RepID=E8U4Q1_DEIML|nr:SRPBCC family protein [Deinococcus maricopensis]ADV68916.1 Polyketide cyclase/dehydrase [Deinococcus maricopensis DSM 21211]
MSPWWKSAILGAVVGTSYGLLMYLLLRAQDDAVGVMLASYLFGVPLVLGLIVSAFMPRAATFGQALGAAAVAVAVFIFTSLLTSLEGLICAAFAFPVLFVMAVLGVAIGWAVRGWRHRTPMVLLSLTLPALLAPLERTQPVPDTYLATADSVVIHAPASAVWAQIRSVPRIEDAELQTSWSHAIGLPRPREAVLDRDGVGGVRVATFDGGLSFTEEVTAWVPARSLAFRIRARDDGKLDPHVRVGGQFFDVLSGQYDVEEVAPGVTVLHLTSTQRVTTHLGGYTRLVVRATMHDLQRTILRVIRRRAEGLL